MFSVTGTLYRKMRMKIIRNAIRCNSCGDIIESTFRHDFKTCSCGRVSVDGGHDYLRRCYNNSPQDDTDLSVTAYPDDDKEESDEKTCKHSKDMGY